MCTKILIKRLSSYKVCLCFVVLSATVCTVGYVCLFCGGQIFVDFISFLSYDSLFKFYIHYHDV